MFRRWSSTHQDQEEDVVVRQESKVKCWIMWFHRVIVYSRLYVLKVIFRCSIELGIS